jgi:replicative DNA helicase|tara:strand:- start:10407 stop:11654 length:1248 start_codon:yes stop_codon:yes gene_type:complete
MDSESFSFVESALVFGLLEDQNFKKFNHPLSQFVVHKDAVEWSMKFRDDFKEAVSNGALLEKYPSLRSDARDTNFDYAQQEFKKQVLFRQVIKSFSDNKTLLSSNPKSALTSIVNSLADVEVGYDEDVSQYDDGETDRLAEYEDRVEKRTLGEGMIGIRTPFRTINATGMGWQPGELVSFFARPTVGKTWLCVKIACEAALQGKKTLLISTEMTKQSIGMRVDVVMSNMMGIKLSHHAIRTGSQMDTALYKKFLQSNNRKNLMISDSISGEESISMSGISGLIRKYRPDICIIDGVYLVSTAVSNRAAWEQSHSLFYGLKNFALANNMTIVAATQATREAGANLFQPPGPNQVAFGDALIRASDVALSMCLVENFPQLRDVQFQKFRDGVLGSDLATLKWDVNQGLITETDMAAM